MAAATLGPSATKVHQPTISPSARDGPWALQGSIFIDFSMIQSDIEKKKRFFESSKIYKMTESIDPDPPKGRFLTKNKDF